ncbi:MAG: SDR family oxidoreductase [Erythrobacter sp.]|nr:SDR family oxidoreductase [Erythrobacter sp.]NCQ63165.1 SDR family oxidoreductase [Alphaproteobacteria bacterium]
MNVLVAGATGLTGQRLVPQLIEAGHTPTALVRDGSDTSSLPEGCATRKGDLTDLPADACEGMDAVIFAAGSGGDTSEEMTDKVDRDGAKALADRAKAAGVKRFVMLSARGVDNPDPDSGLYHYAKAKREADEYLKSSGVDYTIIRPGALTKDDGKRDVRLGDDVEGDGTTARGDLAAVLTRAVDEDSMKNRIVPMESVGI